jgi:hypothetical protein
MSTEDDAAGERHWHDWWRIGFGAFLALAFVVGLYMSLWTGEPAQVRTPEPDPIADATDEPEEEVAGAEPEGEPQVEVEVEEEPTEEPTLSPEEVEELIEAARAPGETSVQVLDAGGGSAALSSAVDSLRETGYRIVNVTSARGDVSTTTVLFTTGNEAEAEALRARDSRFAGLEENDRFSDGVDLHVLVGPDWDS